MYGLPDHVNSTIRPAAWRTLRINWSEKLRQERKYRGWTQADAVRAMRAVCEESLPGDLLSQWKRWERGRHAPSPFYRHLLGILFGGATESNYRLLLTA